MGNITNNAPCCLIEEPNEDTYDYIKNPAELITCRRCKKYCRQDIPKLKPVLVNLSSVSYYCVICSSCYNINYKGRNII